VPDAPLNTADAYVATYGPDDGRPHLQDALGAARDRLDDLRYVTGRLGEFHALLADIAQAAVKGDADLDKIGVALDHWLDTIRGTIHKDSA
jgi:hypothetical protein